MLKTVRINIYINQQIEQKGKELKQQQEGRGYVFRLKRGEGLADFEEDEEEDEEEWFFFVLCLLFKEIKFSRCAIISNKVNK